MFRTSGCPSSEEMNAAMRSSIRRDISAVSSILAPHAPESDTRRSVPPVVTETLRSAHLAGAGATGSGAIVDIATSALPLPDGADPHPEASRAWSADGVQTRGL